MNPRVQEWRREHLRQYSITDFWYFAFIDNLPLILQHGILPKNEVERRGLKYRSFAEETVQARRHHHAICLTNLQLYTIHDVVPVYLCPKTPTLYARRDVQDQLAFVRVRSSVLLDDGIEFAFTDGNAASEQSNDFMDLNMLDQLPWDVIRAPYWNGLPDGKRKRNAEFLIHPRIPVSRIRELGVINEAAQVRIHGMLAQYNAPLAVTIQRDWFFQTMK